jgi:hypothetical protein
LIAKIDEIISTVKELEQTIINATEIDQIFMQGKIINLKMQTGKSDFIKKDNDFELKTD